MTRKQPAGFKTGFLLCLAVLFFTATAFDERQVTWVAIGDSITYLNDHLNETGNRVTKGYLTDVKEKLPNFNYINQGHNGWTAGNIAAKIDNLGLTKADVYTVFLGTNDWWQGRPVGTMHDYTEKASSDTYYGAMGIIINKIRSLNADAKIVLIAPMQRSDFVYVGDHNNTAYGSYKDKNGHTLEEFANAVIAIGKAENLPVVDLYHNSSLAVKKLIRYKRLKNPVTGAYENYRYPAFTQVNFDPAKDDYPYPPDAVALTYDGLHPSDKGNRIIAKALVKVFKGLF